MRLGARQILFVRDGYCASTIVMKMLFRSAR
jgi:hypothetical protein